MVVKAKIDITARDKTKRAFQSVSNSLKGIQSGAASVLTRLAPLIGVAGFAALTAASLKSVDALAKNADKLNVTTQSLASLQHLTDLYTTASAPAMTEALTKATKRLGEFNATGGGAAAVWLKKLNLDTAELATLKPDELFKRYSRSINGLNDRGKQLAAISALMGDESRALIGIVDAGAGVFDEAAKRVEEFGTGVSRLDASRIEDANDSITLMQESVKGLGISLAVDLAPSITDFIGWLLDIEERLDSLSESQLQNRLADTVDELAKINQQIKINGETNGFTAVDPFLIKQLQALGITYAEINRLLDAIHKKSNSVSSVDAGPTASQEKENARLQQEEDNDRQRLAAKFERLNNSLLSEQDRLRLDLEEREFIIEEAFQLGIVTDAERKQALLDIESDHENRITEINKKELDGRLANEKVVADKISDAKLHAFKQGITLLQAFAGKSKTAARAAIVLSKGLAAAEANNANIVAAEAARASATLAAAPGTGVAAGVAAYAQVRALGAVSLGLIAATGLSQAANVGGGGGGASAGSPGNPLTTSPAPPQAINDNANQGTQGTINIVINTGGLVDEEGLKRIAIEKIVPIIRDGIDNHDIILISAGSRNAQEIITSL